jgi:hypothetical protein
VTQHHCLVLLLKNDLFEQVIASASERLRDESGNGARVKSVISMRRLIC